MIPWERILQLWEVIMATLSPFLKYPGCVLACIWLANTGPCRTLLHYVGPGWTLQLDNCIFLLKCMSRLHFTPSNLNWTMTGFSNHKSTVASFPFIHPSSSCFVIWTLGISMKCKFRRTRKHVEMLEDRASGFNDCLTEPHTLFIQTKSKPLHSSAYCQRL